MWHHSIHLKMNGSLLIPTSQLMQLRLINVKGPVSHFTKTSKHELKLLSDHSAYHRAACQYFLYLMLILSCETGK